MEMRSRRRRRNPRTPRRWKWLAFTSIACLPLPRWASAATTLDDIPDSSYTAYSALPQFDSSGFVSVNGGQVFGSGTLIAPDWVITAAHVVTENSTGFPAFPASDVSFGTGASANLSDVDSVSQVIVEPGWSYNLATGDDLALLKLTNPITNITPTPLYTSSLGSELGQTASIVGYGRAGTGLTGDTIGPGTRRGITNVIDSFGGQIAGGLAVIGMSSNLMFTDFDQPGNPLASIMGGSTPTSLEGASAPGDSGGGLYLTVNNSTYLAGVTDFLGAYPDNPLSPNPDGHYGDYNGYTRLSVPQSVSFIDSALLPAASWSNSGSGSWASASNWTNSNIPEFAGASVSFTSASTPATVTLDASWTVGAITFNNTNAYTLSAGTNGTLTIDNGGPAATATITDSAGTQCLSAPLALNSNLLVTVVNAGDSFRLWGNVSGPGGVALAGGGTLSLTGTNTYQGLTSIYNGTLSIGTALALPSGNPIANNGVLLIKSNTIAGNISGGGTLIIGASSTPAVLQLASGSGVSTLSQLTINSGSTLDIGTNSVLINYSGSSPESAVAALIASGYDNGTWSGTGITSSAAAADHGLFAVGYAGSAEDAALQPNQVLISYTIAGDASLSGTVDSADVLTVIQHFQTTGNDWATGAFLYNSQGLVDSADLLIVIQNLNHGVGAEFREASAAQSPISTNVLQPSAVVLPEPDMAIAAGLGALALRRRRPHHF